MEVIPFAIVDLEKDRVHVLINWGIDNGGEGCLVFVHR
jgi:hypothetical protein